MAILIQGRVLVTLAKLRRTVLVIWSCVDRDFRREVRRRRVDEGRATAKAA